MRPRENGSAEKAHIKFPRSMDDVKKLAEVLELYKHDHFDKVLLGFVSLDLFMQSFAIPGTLFLSVLSGALFGVPLGLFIVTCISSCGASGCYLISRTLAGDLVKAKLSNKLATFQRMIEANKHNLFFYLLFLRATPLMPNWFINLSSPHLGVPLMQFFFATMLGASLVSPLCERPRVCTSVPRACAKHCHAARIT